MASPNDFDALVKPELFVGSNDRHALGQCLREDLAIEWICVMKGKAEQLARIDERQKYEDSLDASLDLAKARLSLLRALGHIEDWLNELHAK